MDKELFARFWRESRVHNWPQFRAQRCFDLITLCKASIKATNKISGAFSKYRFTSVYLALECTEHCLIKR